MSSGWNSRDTSLYGLRCGDARDARHRLEARLERVATLADLAHDGDHRPVRPGVLERRQALVEDQRLHADDLGLGAPVRITTNIRCSPFGLVDDRGGTKKQRSETSAHPARPADPGSRIRVRSCRAGKAIDGRTSVLRRYPPRVRASTSTPAVGRGRRPRPCCWYHPARAATERSHSGLVQRFAKPPSGVTCSEGSNPSLSATHIARAPVAQWIEHQLAELGVVGSNPAGRAIALNPARAAARSGTLACT